MLYIEVMWRRLISCYYSYVATQILYNCTSKLVNYVAAIIPLLAIVVLATLLPNNATHTVYTVTPDDHYHPNTTCRHCHNLQHYLLNITKYFTSNTQLLFLPGLHHLHTDFTIQNVHNISLIGSTANGTTLDTVIIQCNSSVGIIMNNIADLTVKNIVLKQCGIITKHLVNLSIFFYTEKAIILTHCLNVQLKNITIFGKNIYYIYPLVAINILGNSSFEHLTCNGFAVEYNEANAHGKDHKLLIENYNVLDYNAVYLPHQNIIMVHMYQYSYKIELKVCNTKFIGLQHVGLFLARLQFNTFGNVFHFSNLVIELLNNEYSGKESTFLIDTYGKSEETKYHNQIHFLNCKFQHNKLNVLLEMHGTLNITLEKCTFAHSQFQIIHAELLNENTITIINTSFSFIVNPTWLIEIVDATLRLEGPVVFTEIEQMMGTPYAAIIYLHNANSNYISFHNYIEFSAITISTIVYSHLSKFVIVQQNTLINMTNNNYGGILWKEKDLVEKIYTDFKFAAPCFYQYYAQEQKLDENTKDWNYSIVFHNDRSIYSLKMTHCSWLPESAFNSTKPIDVNKRIIKSDFGLIQEKCICYCLNDTKSNCYVDTLATIYPGQKITLKMMLSKEYSIESSSAVITVEMNANISPETACKLAKTTEVSQKVYNYCTPINYTITHNEMGYLQWCELFIIIKEMYVDAFYINMLPCPSGFIQSSGICMCDPILNSKLLPVTTCDINYQTILRPAGSWLSAVTINDSHQYHVSPHCPFHYCLPRSSHLNFSAPNSQCQFNRSGLLCGHCQQGLSTVFGYSQCQHCSNVYLLLVIPIAVAGLVLVLLLFILNLTVTDGDINGFILYVNIISINNHAFFPQYSDSINLAYAFISLANLDLGIPTCFYNGMDDYAKMWLQLAFPAYLILIATLLIIASRHSIKVQRITARRALPVLATLFLLSYTKILSTVSSVLFYYSTITHLPSEHTTLVWAVDANVPLFGMKYTTLFIMCLILFIILLPFNAILCFTKTAMRLRLVNHFKPLIDAYQGPYKYKYYYWTGLQLVIRAVFFGLSTLGRNINLTTGIILLAVIIIIQRSLNPFKDCYKNVYEIGFIFNLLTIYALSYGHYDIPINTMITMVALQFLVIILHHIITNICGELVMNKLKNVIEMTIKCITRSKHIKPQHIELKNTPPDKAYNYQELREPLVDQN